MELFWAVDTIIMILFTVVYLWIESTDGGIILPFLKAFVLPIVLAMANFYVSYNTHLSPFIFIVPLCFPLYFFANMALANYLEWRRNDKITSQIRPFLTKLHAECGEEYQTNEIFAYCGDLNTISIHVTLSNKKKIKDMYAEGKAQVFLKELKLRFPQYKINHINYH